jgi:hypothetical protein
MGSGQIFIVCESFKDRVESRRLEPGNDVRIAVSPLKSTSIDEEAGSHAAAAGNNTAGGCSPPDALCWSPALFLRQALPFLMRIQ